MFELLTVTGLGIAMFLPLANPLTTVALLLGLSGHMSNEQRNHQSLLTCIYVFIIMVVAFYGGHLVMSTFGISIPGLRIAGGMIIAVIGFRMLFPTPPQPSKSLDHSDTANVTGDNTNIAFVPLAIPSTAGPGTIAMIISTASAVKSGEIEVTPWVVYVASFLIPFLISVILWLSMRSSGTLMRLVGKSGIEAISRIMGFLLVCMGTQFVINGIKEIIEHFPNI